MPHKYNNLRYTIIRYILFISKHYALQFSFLISEFSQFFSFHYPTFVNPYVVITKVLCSYKKILFPNILSIEEKYLRPLSDHAFPSQVKISAVLHFLPLPLCLLLLYIL